MGRIRLRCIEMGTSRNWGLLVKDAMIDINTQCVRLHGYTPSEILLGYTPVTSRRPVVEGENKATRALNSNVPASDEDTIHVYMDLRDERGEAASQRLAEQQDRIQPRASRGYKKPQVGELVLVRDVQLAKEKGKKLEP